MSKNIYLKDLKQKLTGEVDDLELESGQILKIGDQFEVEVVEQDSSTILPNYGFLIAQQDNTYETSSLDDAVKYILEKI